MPSRFGDYETDWLIPIGIMGLVGSLASFFIAVRSVLGFGDEALLTYLCFWLLIGSIGISLLRYRAGGPLTAGPYAIGLAIALWLFLTGYTFQYGGLVGATRNYYAALFANYSLGALIWISSNWLTKNCTVDEEEAAKGQEGVFDSLFRQAAVWRPGPPGRQHGPRWVGVPHRPRKHVGRSVIIFSVVALILFGLGQRFIPSGDEEAHRRAFWSMAAYTFFALFLLSLTNLSSLRIYLSQRKMRLPAVLTPIWIGVTLPLILIILLVAGALPRRDVAGVEPPGGELRPLVSFLPAWKWGLRQSGRQAPKPRIRVERVHGRKAQSKGKARAQREVTTQRPPRDLRKDGGLGKVREQSAEEGRTQEELAYGRQAGREGQRGQPRTGKPTGERSRAAPHPSRALQMPHFTAPQIPWMLLGLIALAIVLFFMLALLARWLAKHFPRGLLARLRRKKGKREDEFEVDIWANPFADPRLSPAQVVDHVYRVLLAYGKMMRKPRPPWQTPYEYYRSLPPSMEDVQSAARALTQLYVRAAYTPGSVEASVLPDLEKIWRDLQGRIAQFLAAEKQKQLQPAPA
jgi:hypothetical protein